MWYGIGFTAMFILCSFPNEAIYSIMKKAYTVLMGCLVYLLISRILISVSGNAIHLPFAGSINGAVSWFSLPFASFQPSEFIKIVLIVLVSKTIALHQDEHPEPTNKDDLNLLIKIAKIVVPPMVLILLQPDTGVMIIIALTTMILLMCSGIRKQYIWVLFILIGIAVAGFFYLYFFQRELLEVFVSNYRLSRIDAWLDPEGNISWHRLRMFFHDRGLVMEERAEASLEDLMEALDADEKVLCTLSDCVLERPEADQLPGISANLIAGVEKTDLSDPGRETVTVSRMREDLDGTDLETYPLTRFLRAWDAGERRILILQKGDES